MPGYNTVKNFIPKYLKPESCLGCPLYHMGTGFSIPEGYGTNKVLLVGEALGAHEAKEGLPFRPQADAGSVLERAFRSIGIPRDQFALFNVVACRPPDNRLAGEPYEFDSINHCKQHFDAVFDAFQPDAMVALGATAFRTLTAMTGDKQSLGDLRGYAIPAVSTKYSNANGPVPVIGTYHPSFIVRGAWNMFAVLCRDIRFAVQCAKNGFPSQEVEYNENPTKQDLERLLEWLKHDPDLPLSIDWETQNEVDPQKKRKWQNEVITQVNLSVAEATGLALANWEPHKGIIQDILATPNRKVGHNIWGFDYLVAQVNGLEIRGPIDDGMLKFHHMYPDLPGKEAKKGENEEEEGGFAPLQFVSSFYGFPFPWKFESSARPQWYGCADVDSALRNDFGLTEDLKSKGIYEGYLELVAELAPVLVNMASRGIPVNRKMLHEFGEQLKKDSEKVMVQIQALIPPELIPTKQKEGLKKQPKDTEGLVQRSFFIEAHYEKCKCVKPRKKDLEYWQQHPNGTLNKKGTLITPAFDCAKCNGEGKLFIPGRDEIRWCKLLEFNPESSDQLKQYALTKGHKIPASSKNKGKKRNKDGPQKISMDTEVITKLAKQTGDPLYSLVIEHKAIEKLETTYVKGWEPDTDERVHTQFAMTPATGQLSSMKPNVQNVPNVSKQGEKAARFNQCIEAEPGYTWVIFDYKSFHAQTLGLEAKCPEYVRLARLDIHSYLASHLLKLPKRDEALSWPDDQLMDWLKHIKKNYEKVRNKQAKPGILGYGFGLGGDKLYAMNEDSFNNKMEAVKVIDMLDRIFPAVAHFRNTIPLRAKQQGGYLISEFKCIRWFFDIQHLDTRTGRMARGGDWEKAIAFLPANDAFGMVKQAMLNLEYSGQSEKYGMVNQVHDALYFHCPDKFVEDCIHDVQEEMERPSNVLFMPDGSPFSVAVEAKMGKNWKDVEEVKEKTKAA